MSHLLKIKLKPIPPIIDRHKTPTVSFKELLNKHKKLLKSRQDKSIFHFGSSSIDNNNNSSNNNNNKRNDSSSSDSELESKETKLMNKKDMTKLLKSEKVTTKLKDFVYPNRFTNTNSLRKSNSTFEFSQNKFRETKYSDKDSFNLFYKKMHRISEYKRKGANNTLTPSFTFIKSSNENLIVPNPIGIVKKKGDPDIININHKRMGDKYIQSLSQGLTLATHVSELSLSQNRLTDVSVKMLFDVINSNINICKRLLSLNLGYNKIGPSAIDSLCNYIDNIDCNLEHLDLEANCLGNRLVNLVLSKINDKIASQMKYLNFAQNNLNDDVAPEFAVIGRKCEHLQVLILYQNHFKNFGMSLIMSELKNHCHLKFLDISWNLIGTNLNEELPTRDELLKCSKDPKKVFNNAELEELKIKMEYPKVSLLKKSVSVPVLRNTISPFTRELCELFKNENIELLHLDISHNNIGYVDCAQIAIDVKNNHTILGIHVDGNDMFIDELGFIYAYEKNQYEQNHFASSQIFYRIDNENPLIKSNIINVKKIRGKNHCWICEGWNEVAFEYHPTQAQIEESNIKYKKKKKKKVPCKVCLNFENYKGFDMNINRADNSYICYRMCPPGDVQFFYTYDSVPCDVNGDNVIKLKEAVVHMEEITPPKPPGNDDDNDNEEEEVESQHDTQDKEKGGIEEITEEITDDPDREPPEARQFIIPKVYHNKVIINPEVIDAKLLMKLIPHCIPRPLKKIIKKKRIRTPWTFPVSIWAYYGYDYKGEKDSKLNDAFEFDFNRGQYSKDKELQKPHLLQELKTILRRNYPQMLEAYKNLSAVLGWKVWQIGQNSISEFASNCPGLLDGKYLINDVLVKLTETKNNPFDKAERKQNPNIPDNIIRHQWMMLLVKIAKDKYFRTKIKSTVPDAVQVSFELHYTPYLSQYRANRWREERYYNENVDNVIKAYLPLFDAVYRSQASMKQVGRKDSASLWLEEFTTIVNALMDTDFPVKEIPIIFNLSMRLQVNEIDYDKHYNMMFPEFLEGFARFADRMSPVPIGENREKWTMQMRNEQELSVKIETIIPSMPRLITNQLYKNVKEKFVFPERDSETGLLKIDYTNPFYFGLLPPKNFGKRRAGVKKKSIILRNNN